MIELAVYNRQGEVVGHVEVDETLFGSEVRPGLLRQAARMYEAARRAGTASTRTRAEVAGSKAKPWRQKGTGRARAGSRRSPIWRSGGVVFGPKPRDYRFRMPRKAVRAATRSAYLAKLKADAVTVVDELTAEVPKTKPMAATLAAIGIEKKCLIVIASYDANLWKSARNISGIAMKPLAEVNAYDILRWRRLLFTRDALEKLIETVRPQPADAAQAPEAPEAVQPPEAPETSEPGEPQETAAAQGEGE